MADDERYTEFGLVYNLLDVTARADASTAFTNYLYSDRDSLLGTLDFNEYMTLEKNFSVLDGSKTEFPTTPEEIGLFSSSKSDSTTGTMTTVPTITVTCQEHHNTVGLTFFFNDTYPKEVRVQYYQDTSLLGDYTYTITGNKYVAEQEVVLWNKLIIQFPSTTIPDRYVKLTGLLFGKSIDWGENIVQTASLTQDMNRISDLLSIDTLTFTLIDDDNSLNFGNEQGIHRFFQRKQEMLPYEIVNDQKIPLGRFYLDTYSYEKNLAKMNAVSFIGLMDGIAFNEGELYDGVTAKTVIDKIFEVAEFEHYTIDEETANQLLYGTITPTNCRMALKEVLFACGSILDYTDSQNVIKICKTSHAQSYVLDRTTKINTKITTQPYISGVEVQYPIYELVEDAAELAKDTYEETGDYLITFTTPCIPSTVTISSNATLTKVRPFYAEFTVHTVGEVIVSGKGYAVNNKKVKVAREFIDPGQIENTITYTTTLCNKTTAKELATKLFYYNIQYTLTLDIQHIASDISMNDLRYVQNTVVGYNGYLAMFTTRTFDLTGGFIDNSKLIAYYNHQDFEYYGKYPQLQQELYSGGTEII